MSDFLIYGATGFTGKLTAELAVERGLKPVLAGRSADKVARLGARLGLEHRAFSLDDPAEVRRGIDGMAAVLHDAGPFAITSAPMVDACLATGTHYLDITGELTVFEAVHARDAEAKDAGVALIPGVGFDVVPTDCLAAVLAEALPGATHLELAFIGLGARPSAGTTKSAVGMFGHAMGAVRQDGEIRKVGVGYKERDIPFPSKTRHASSIPWGDVSTAYYSTGIPNIVVYMGMKPARVRWLKRLSRLQPLFRSGLVRRAAKRVVEMTVEGPDAAARASARSEVWGEVTNAAGDRVSGSLVCPEGYTFTADSSLRAVVALLDSELTGALTPSKAFGADFVRACDNVEVMALERSGSPRRTP